MGDTPLWISGSPLSVGTYRWMRARAVRIAGSNTATGVPADVTHWKALCTRRHFNECEWPGMRNLRELLREDEPGELRGVKRADTYVLRQFRLRRSSSEV
jgi:hypothetical protein